MFLSTSVERPAGLLSPGQNLPLPGLALRVEPGPSGFYSGRSRPCGPPSRTRAETPCLPRRLAFGSQFEGPPTTTLGGPPLVDSEARVSHQLGQIRTCPIPQTRVPGGRTGHCPGIGPTERGPHTGCGVFRSATRLSPEMESQDMGSFPGPVGQSDGPCVELSAPVAPLSVAPPSLLNTECVVSGDLGAPSSEGGPSADTLEELPSSSQRKALPNGPSVSVCHHRCVSPGLGRPVRRCLGRS